VSLADVNWKVGADETCRVAPDSFHASPQQLAGRAASGAHSSLKPLKKWGRAPTMRACSTEEALGTLTLGHFGSMRAIAGSTGTPIFSSNGCLNVQNTHPGRPAIHQPTITASSTANSLLDDYRRPALQHLQSDSKAQVRRRSKDQLTIAESCAHSF